MINPILTNENSTTFGVMPKCILAQTDMVFIKGRLENLLSTIEFSVEFLEISLKI